MAYGPGFTQYFEETPFEWISAAREGLQTINAHGMASLLDQAILLLPDGELPQDADSREALLDNLTEEQEDEIYKVCGRFTNEPYPDESLELFAKKHDAHFTGPRTQLELWQSKVDRGVDTTPV